MMTNSKVKTPWLDNYGDIPHTLNYFEGTMFEAVCKAADKYPKLIAFDFFGKKTKYRLFIQKIKECAGALCALGIGKDDRVTIALPNCPQAVILFYAINLVGAVSNMIHPLSSENEIKFFINKSNSKAAVTLDQFYEKFEKVQNDTCLKHLIITSIKDELPFPTNIGYTFTKQRKFEKFKKDAPIIRWHEFLKGSKKCNPVFPKRNKNDVAVILYSGGTTGTTKGILLSNYNFNALAAQVIATNPIFCAGDKMLAVMPMFHGFGLGVSIHSMLANGGRCILVPRFTPASYAKLIKKSKCNFIAGVPTLFEALTRQQTMNGADLSSLKGVFSGGDTLSSELKHKFDSFLKERGCKVQIREGYGTTECVTASCLTPLHLTKEGSIGQPFPDMYYKIVKPSTFTEVDYGQEGEICISGPTVMLGYMDKPEETANVLKTHDDGLVWIHTGDLGFMDSDGFVYFKQRIKRMIVTSGYNVYPSQLENVLDANELVQMSCIIGVADSYKMQKIKAFIVLKDGIEPSEQVKEKIMNYCRKNITKYALPYDIEFRESLPKTLVGKVAYRELEEQELNKNL